MLTCRELVELVTDYLDAALPQERQAEVVAHLRHCEDCLRYLAQLQATRQVLATASSPALWVERRAPAVGLLREEYATAQATVDMPAPWWRRLRRATGPR